MTTMMAENYINAGLVTFQFSLLCLQVIKESTQEHKEVA